MFRASSRLLVVLLATVLAAPALAQWSPSSVFTDDGVEIGIEPRVFAVFALLNSAGYDKETVFGDAPLEVPQFSAIREKLRTNQGRTSNKPLIDLITQNPGSLDAYIDAALELGPAPRFDDSAAKSKLAKALAPALREWFNEEGGSALLRNANADLKDTQKRLLPIVDKAIKRTTGIVRLGDVSDQLLDDAGAQGRVALVLNELDAHGTLSVHVAGDTTGIFVGPFRNDVDERAAVDAAVFAFAGTLVVREMNKVEPAGTLLAAHARVSAAVKKTFTTPKAWGRALMSCAVAREVLKRPTSCPGLAGDAESDTALAVIAPRLAEFAPTKALFSAALPDLLAAPPPPPEVPAVVEEPKGKGKGKK